MSENSGTAFPYFVDLSDLHFKNFLESSEYDAVFDTVSDLCTKSEQLAFYAGARIGAALMMELADAPLR